MWTLLLASVALAGDLVIDARIPVEVFDDGHLVAQIIQPAELHLVREPGRVALTLMVGGDPKNLYVDVPAEGRALVLVGKIGISSSIERPSTEADEATEPPATVTGEIRLTGDQEVTLVLDGKRQLIRPRAVVDISLAPGEHAMSLRSGDGTVVWATGKLLVDVEPFVVQLSPGRMPETSGGATAFLPDGG